MDELQHRDSFAESPSRLPVRRARSAWLVVVAVIGLLLSASSCASWRGARLYHSGTQALEQGDVPRALADLEGAAALVPEASEVHNNLGLAQLSAGQEDRALLSFQRATELDCANASARDNLRSLEARRQQEERSAAIDRVSAPLSAHHQTRHQIGHDATEPHPPVCEEAP